MEQEKSIICYEQAAMALPGRLRRAAMAEPKQRQAQAEEFRLRAGRTMTIPLTLVLFKKVLPFPSAVR